MPTSVATAKGLAVLGRSSAEFASILTPEALAFVEKLERKFGARRKELLAKRAARQKEFDAGKLPDFLPETKELRDKDWTVAPLPKDLLDRRVEITGPTDRKMVINALNCGANVFMADFEDANTPTWDNLIEGQINLSDAIAGSIGFDDPATGKHYALGDKLATLLVRPRGWHLPERHLMVDGEPISGSLFDFGLFFFHNAKPLLAKGSGPYFYLPKLESHLEARLWNDVFLHAQAKLGVPKGSIKATVLIETIMAAFEMDEILYELREHSSGLNCGRWDYIYSFIKKFAEDPKAVLPDRAQVTMTSHFLRSYSLALIKTCHRRNVHAMGGMAAQIPIRSDPEANAQAMDKVRADKLRAALQPHGGRRHRRDQPRPDLAMDPPRREAAGRPVGRPRALPADAGGGIAEAPQERGRGSLRQGPLRGRRPDLPRHDRCAQVRGVPDAPGLRQGGRRGQVIGGYYNL